MGYTAKRRESLLSEAGPEMREIRAKSGSVPPRVSGFIVRSSSVSRARPTVRVDGRDCHFCYLAVLTVVSSLVGSNACLAQRSESYRELRLKMVSEYIEREGINNPRVLNSLRQVPRHEFVTS